MSFSNNNTAPATQEEFTIVLNIVGARGAKMAEVEVHALCDRYAINGPQRREVLGVYNKVNAQSKANQAIAAEVDRRRFIKPVLVGAARPAWLDNA